MNNLASGADAAFAKLDADDNLDVIEYDCLTYCDLCATSLFALVDGEVVRGETAEELVANIYTFLEENCFNIEKAMSQITSSSLLLVKNCLIGVSPLSMV